MSDDSCSAEALGARIRLARDNREYTQTELAHLIGISRSSIANIEAGRQTISAYDATRYAHLLGVDIGWLLTGRQPTGMPQPPRQPVKAKALLALAEELERAALYLRDAAREVERAAAPSAAD